MNPNFEDAKNQALSFIEEIQSQGHSIIYLTIFGSYLYGIETEDSDFDFKGIFLPSKKSCLLNSQPKTYNYKSDGIDIELYSIQWWFNHLIRRCETTGLDLLYSITNEKAVLYMEEDEFLYKTMNTLVDKETVDKSAFVKYAIGQAQKYGIRGTRLNNLIRVKDYLDSRLKADPFFLSGDTDIRLGHFSDDLLLRLGENTGLHKAMKDSMAYLVINDSWHMYTISSYEFYKRIEEQEKIYGNRAKLAEQNLGVDWKAISHAIRAIEQMKELLSSGSIEFPLKKADMIRDIKLGKKTWAEVTNMFNDGLDEIEQLKLTSKVKGRWNQSEVNSIILNLYDTL